jgi:hypothetical protein
MAASSERHVPVQALMMGSWKGDISTFVTYINLYNIIHNFTCVLSRHQIAKIAVYLKACAHCKSDKFRAAKGVSNLEDDTFAILLGLHTSGSLDQQRRTGCTLKHFSDALA